jgi:hypothetical protein
MTTVPLTRAAGRTRRINWARVRRTRPVDWARVRRLLAVRRYRARWALRRFAGWVWPLLLDAAGLALLAAERQGRQAGTGAESIVSHHTRTTDQGALVGFRYGLSYKLRFETDELDGLIVKVKPTSMATLIKILDLPKPQTLADGVRRLATMLGYFVESLDEWNLEDESGQPTPHDPDVIQVMHPREVIDQILGAWIGSMAGVSAPLDQPSPNGEQSLVASIPMEVLSESPPS